MSLQKIILTRVIIFLFLIPYTHALVEPSYFVLTSGEYSTNLGNLTGADSKCLTDLSNSTWLGKSNVVLNADKVEAFLCTSSLCSTLASNTEYFFAKSGSTTAGGASFTTNGSGIGPADSTSWEGLTYFNVSSDTNWWSNRAPDPTSPTLYFSNTPADSPAFYNVASTSCTDWTTAAFGGSPYAGFGSAKAFFNTARSRYANDNGVNYCGDAGTDFLICAVTGSTILIEHTTLNPENSTYTTNTTVELNFTIDADLNSLIYNWNGTNFTFYNDSLVLMINFNNISALGENNTHVVDLSKYENNGTSEGDASPTISGKYDGGWTFDGSGDSIDVGSGSSVDFGGETDITIALWANVSQSTSDDNKYIFKGNQFDFQVQNSLNNRIRFEVNNGSWQSCITGNNVAEIGTWAHYTATYNGSEAKIYKNAELVKSCTITGSFNADGDSQSLCISTTTTCGGQDAEINGSIDELMIWNTTLNAQEIYQLYASNFHKYDSDSWELYVNQSYNATNSLPDGNYTFYSFTTNSSGTENTTATRIITVDTTLPEISIIYPSNNTNYSDNGLDINYTAVDTNLDSCWYTNGTGSANATLSNCANITNVTWPENTYNITIWANDSAGNLDNSNVTFTIDYTSPQWQNNETNLTPVIMLGTSIYFNITLNDSRPSHYIFSFYNGSTWINDSAVSYSNGEEIYVVKNTSIASGYINWTWYINDTAGNLNQTNMFNAVMTATDTDEDGVIDLSDPLFYNESNVSSSGITRLNITVGGNATNETFSDLQEVKFYDSSNLLMNFSHNFSETNLDLSNITVNLDSTWMLINLSGQVQAEYNKTIYITDNSFASLCVKDAEISSISNISVECNQANETDFTSCLGGSLTDNGITCEDQGTIIKISNLMHSGVRGTPAVNTATSGGGGGSSGKKSVSTSQTTINIKKTATPQLKAVKETGCSFCNTNEICKNNHCVKLFDILITKFQSKNIAGKIIFFDYTAKAMANISDDVNIIFWIEQDGEIISSGKDVVYIGNLEEVSETGSLLLPTTIRPGDYTLFIKLNYDHYNVESYRTIEIAVDEDGNTTLSNSSVNKDQIFTFLMLIFLMILIVYFGRNNVLKRKKTTRSN